MLIDNILNAQFDVRIIQHLAESNGNIIAGYHSGCSPASLHDILATFLSISFVSFSLTFPWLELWSTDEESLNRFNEGELRE